MPADMVNAGPQLVPATPPDIRLAFSQYEWAIRNLKQSLLAPGADESLNERTVDSDAQDVATQPALLVSYVFYKKFAKHQSELRYRDWMLDSGAFSAWNSGKEIDVHQYIEDCQRLRACDNTLKEIIALDVIGSGSASFRNAVIMKDAGVEAMPVFHIGDDWGILREYAAGWDKVGLSCRFGEPPAQSLKFYDQCFAKVWPKKLHSFGWIAEDVMMRYPFHSGDSSSWTTGPACWGRWKTFGNMTRSASNLRLSPSDFRCEIWWYIRMEARCRAKWQPLFAQLRWDKRG